VITDCWMFGVEKEENGEFLDRVGFRIAGKDQI
jgi:hypothetical protein